MEFKKHCIARMRACQNGHLFIQNHCPIIVLTLVPFCTERKAGNEPTGQDHNKQVKKPLRPVEKPYEQNRPEKEIEGGKCPEQLFQIKGIHPKQGVPDKSRRRRNGIEGKVSSIGKIKLKVGIPRDPLTGPFVLKDRHPKPVQSDIGIPQIVEDMPSGVSGIYQISIPFSGFLKMSFLLGLVGLEKDFFRSAGPSLNDRTRKDCQRRHKNGYAKIPKSPHLISLSICFIHAAISVPI